MGSVIRALAVYGFLLLIFRISGKRSLAEITTFDAILLLIISEAIQQALIDSDESMVNGFLIVATLVVADVLMSVWAYRSSRVDRILNDAPVVILDHGKVLQDRLKRSRISEDDILERARELQGIERLDQLKYAVLERSGSITVIPRSSASSGGG